MPYFSIVIPVFNKENFVGNTLKSVLSQTFTDYEIILVNDGSTDQSEAVIKTFTDNRIRYFFKENEGVATARNFGIDKANGSFICFLDADDFWYPNFLENFHLYSKKLPEQKVFACAIEIETKNKTLEASYSIAKEEDYKIVDFFEASQKEGVLWTSSVMIHKSVFETVGNFDTKIKKGEDTELWIRIGLQFPVVFVWKIAARYVYDAKSASRNWNYYFEPYTFEKYASEEKKNPKLKQYLDLNRFSAVIKCKLNGDMTSAKSLYKQINLDTLGWQKIILLQLPSIVLKFLVNFKNFLSSKGLGKSVFR